MRETPLDNPAYDTLLDEIDDIIETLDVRVGNDDSLNDKLSTHIEELTHRTERLYGRQQF